VNVEAGDRVHHLLRHDEDREAWLRVDQVGHAAEGGGRDHHRPRDEP
jgi:hypothetical protein